VGNNLPRKDLIYILRNKWVFSEEHLSIHSRRSVDGGGGGSGGYVHRLEL